jgi:hypothetical protein
MLPNFRMGEFHSMNWRITDVLLIIAICGAFLMACSSSRTLPDPTDSAFMDGSDASRDGSLDAATDGMLDGDGPPSDTGGECSFFGEACASDDDCCDGAPCNPITDQCSIRI